LEDPELDDIGEIINFTRVKQDISERKDGKDEVRKLSSIVEENSDLFGIASPGTPKGLPVTPILA
jgi:hypothetical protein